MKPKQVSLKALLEEPPTGDALFGRCKNVTLIPDSDEAWRRFIEDTGARKHKVFQARRKEEKEK